LSEENLRSGTFWNFGTDFHPFLRFCDSRNGRKTVPSENVPLPEFATRLANEDILTG